MALSDATADETEAETARRSCFPVGDSSVMVESTQYEHPLALISGDTEQVLCRDDVERQILANQVSIDARWKKSEPLAVSLLTEKPHCNGWNPPHRRASQIPPEAAQRPSTRPSTTIEEPTSKCPKIGRENEDISLGVGSKSCSRVRCQ